MAKKLIAIVMALALVLSFAACGGKGDDTTTAPETTTDPFDAFGEETTAAPAEDSSATDASAPVADDTTAAPADATTAAAGDTTTAAAAKAPQTKEEIVAYFNTAINGVKKGAKSVTHHYSKISLNGATKLPSWANSVLKLLGAPINSLTISSKRTARVRRLSPAPQLSRPASPLKASPGQASSPQPMSRAQFSRSRTANT